MILHEMYKNRFKSITYFLMTDGWRQDILKMFKGYGHS